MSKKKISKPPSLFFNKANCKEIIFVISSLCFFVFVFFVVIVQATLDYRLGNYFIEAIKMAQFISLVFLLTLLIKKYSRLLAFLTSSLACFVQLILTIYFSFANKRLDFAFFYRNKENLIDVIAPYGPRILFLLGTSFIIGYFLYQLDLRMKKSKQLVLVALSLVLWLFFPIIQGERYLNETLFFFKSAFVQDEVVEKYQEKYRKLVEQSIRNKQSVLKKSELLENKKVPQHLENIIFLQLESVNGRLINEENSPNYYRLAQRGILYENFYGNSVQTILGQENILCSLPTSFHEDLVTSGYDKEVLCLPEIFKLMGYNTAFYKTYSLVFESTGLFMSNIGFKDLYDYGIMRKDDPMYTWGYREDVFYNRVFEHIRNNYEDRGNFFFIEVGPTNHWPFDTPVEFAQSVPHKNPKNHSEKLVNTTYIQDKHLEVAWKEIERTFPAGNFTVVILGDHSWPHGEHKDNEFCVAGSFDENFKTSLAIIFNNHEENAATTGKRIKTEHSQMDILPSFASLIGVDLERNEFQKDLFRQEEDNKKILLIQPFLEKTISTLGKGKKYQYRIRDKELVFYDLKADPAEKNGMVLSKKNNDPNEIFKKLFHEHAQR